jgi:hypothetical protein
METFRGSHTRVAAQQKKPPAPATALRNNPIPMQVERGRRAVMLF